MAVDRYMQVGIDNGMEANKLNAHCCAYHKADTGGLPCVFRDRVCERKGTAAE